VTQDVSVPMGQVSPHGSGAFPMDEGFKVESALPVPPVRLRVKKTKAQLLNTAARFYSLKWWLVLVSNSSLKFPMNPMKFL